MEAVPECEIAQHRHRQVHASNDWRRTLRLRRSRRVVLTEKGDAHRTREVIRTSHIVLNGREGAVAAVGKHYGAKCHEKPEERSE